MNEQNKTPDSGKIGGLSATTGSAGWPSACPICNAPARWKISGRGKHYGQLCSEHGFVGLRANPLMACVRQKPRSLITRILEAIF